MTSKVWALLLLLGSLLQAAWGADTAAPANPPVTVSRSEAELRLFNRTVFVFRGPLSGYSAEDRAQRAKTRIIERLELGGANQLGLQPDTQGLLLQIDGATAFIITPADLDSSQDDSLQALGARTQATLHTVLQESRESRDMRAMLRASLWALGATALALALAWAAARIRQRAAQGLQHMLARHANATHIAGLPLLHPERAVALGRALLNAAYQLLRFVLAYNWLSFVLSCFPYTRAWGEVLIQSLLSLVGSVGNAMLQAIPGLATALLIFFLARGFNRLLAGLFERVQSGQISLTWLDADMVVPTRRIGTALVWLFALAMAYPYLPGAQTEAFKGLSVLAGLMLSLGSSSLVGQAASGLILTYGRVFRKGEYVRVAEHEGTVTEMGMFATRIRTGLGEELTIANSKILESTTRNYSRAVKGAGFVLDTKVTIGYDTAWRQVHAMLIEAARRTDSVLADPPPQVFQTALSDWYPQYRLVCQATATQPRPRAMVLSQLHANIQDVFNEYGVQIMSPQYFEDPAEAKIVPPARWYPAPAQGPLAP